MNKIVALRYLSDNYIFPRKVSTYHLDLKETFYSYLRSLNNYQQKKYVLGI